jgi:hypothetical protein
MKRSLLIILFFFLLYSDAISQEKTVESLHATALQINGYTSAMQSVLFDSLKGNFSNDNLIHNRFNFKGFLGEHITFAVELRNRIFTGAAVKNSDYSKLIGNDPGLIDLSWNLADEKSFLINTTIDRYWLDLNYGKFQARIGRQRINWGQTFVWNPNDIFNAYSFFDFDYVEKPGSDAIRLQYYPRSSSSLEVAVKADNNNEITAAGLYRINKWGYDIQVLAGYVNSEDYVAGAGWSGAVGSLSFRGEASWFQPAKHFSDSTGRGLFTIGFDKVFRDNSMVQIQVMYCNQPLRLTSFNSFYSGDLSSKDLAFSRFSAFGQITIPVTPLLNIGVSSMWFPDLDGYYAGPSVDYSLAENVDFSLIWQHFDSKMGGITTRMNIGFLRLKWSF